MINFKPLELEDRDTFLRYLGEYGFNTYEYTFLTLYIWRKMCRTEIAILDNTLIIKKTDKRTGSYFMQPIGYTKDTLKDIIYKLKDFKQSNSGFASLFGDIETPFLEELKSIWGEDMVFREDINNFDYIYDSGQLILLSGSKYHRKKNQYNQFVNNYRYEIRELWDKEVRKDCIDFARVWYHEKSDKSELLLHELNSIEDILTHMESLDILGIAVYVDNELAGFSIGERANDNMAIVHIEKGNPTYSGIYSFLNKALVEKYFRDITFINRQEDLGIEGLRKAKMAYQPVRFEKKYRVDEI